VHLTDDALKKLWDREKMIKEFENDLNYIQNKIERGKQEKTKGKRGRPYKAMGRDTVNEDCLNISVDHPMGQVGAG
jgi:hypothetical protein